MLPIIFGLVIAAGSAIAYWNMPSKQIAISILQEQPALDKKQVILARLIKQGAVQSWGTTPSP